MTTIDCSIVIVSYNVVDLLRACLNSIQQSPMRLSAQETGHGPCIEVIVVDSASTDHTVSMLQKDYSWVTTLAQQENVGFTRGNNIGLAQARGRHLFLLNPDTELVRDALPAMIAYLDEHPQVGIVGPHTLNTDGSTQSSKRRFPTRKTAFFESTWLQFAAPRGLLDDFYAADIPDDAIAEVDWVQGSALMARREVYEQIGGLDEGYIMYSEELDWCYRAKQAGWSVVYLGTSDIVHHGGKSSEQVGARKHIYFQQSKIRYFSKVYGLGFARFLRAFLLLNYAWQLAIEGLKSLIGHRREMRRQRVATYWQVLRHGLRAN